MFYDSRNANAVSGGKLKPQGGSHIDEDEMIGQFEESILGVREHQSQTNTRFNLVKSREITAMYARRIPLLGH